MARTNEKPNGALRPLEKAPSGIEGLDEITHGGLPRGRPTLVCGGAGTGKTLLALQFLVKGITDHNEPGVFIAFEETEEELARNVASLGFDLQKLIRQKKLFIDYVRVERHEIEETGEYDLEGLFVRIDYAIKTVGAKRIVLDTLESLFAGLANASVLRAEFRRLFRWLKDNRMTAIVTAEAGDDGAALTRQGMEEYVSDCVILLDHRVAEHMTARRMRVVKYRGSTHGTNEYPFLIGQDGISVVPVTSLGLQHEASTERVSTGLARLDTMLGGRGYYRGSSVLVSGTAGTGKTSIAASFVAAASARGEKCLYFAFEESQSQITRNMRSIGIDLDQWARKGALTFQTQRPTDFGLELHLATIFKSVREMKPSVVVIDPITNFFAIGSQTEIRSMLTRLIDFLKSQVITTLFTSLTPGGGAVDLPEVGISSLIDTWLLVREVESNGERNRLLHVLKSRGMPHSNQVREFVITSHGIDLLDVYVGASGVLTGSARVALEAREEAERSAERSEAERQRAASERRQKALEAQIAALQADLESERQDWTRIASEESLRSQAAMSVRDAMARRRSADMPPPQLDIGAGGNSSRRKTTTRTKGGHCGH